VVLFHDVVEVLTLAWPGATPKLSASLHLRDGLWISRIFVDGDGARIYRVWLNECFAKEPFRGCRVPFRRQQDSIISEVIPSTPGAPLLECARS
jgi:hypothetical protein